MQTQNQPTTQQEMGKRKFLDASNARGQSKLAIILS